MEYLEWDDYEVEEDGGHMFAATVVEHCRTAMLVGPPGTGKSYLARQVGLKLGMEVMVVPMTSDTSAADLIGYYVPNSDGEGWRWNPGPALTAFQTGGMLILDDMDRSTDIAGAKTILHHLTDEPETAHITLPIPEDDKTYKTIKAHPNFKCIATSNHPNPFEDDAALSDRFPIVLPILKAHKDALTGFMHSPLAMGIATKSSRKARAYWDLQTKLEAQEAQESIGKWGKLNIALRAVEPTEHQQMQQAADIALSDGPTAA